MKERENVQIDENKSEPQRIELSDGSYLLWDYQDPYYRVAHYQRITSKSSDLEMSISIAMKKPIHNYKVKAAFGYIKATDEYAATCSS